jgi:urease accessory protein UreE
MTVIEVATGEMKRVFAEIPYGVAHTLQVLDNARQIMDGEGLSGSIRDIVSLAAVLHDIGAVAAQKKHGSMEGRFQEIEGPAIAQTILECAGAPPEAIARICYIVGNHHTPARIDGLDFQILWEADYLETLLFEASSADRETVRARVAGNFRTASGLRLAYDRLGLTNANAGSDKH